MYTSARSSSTAPGLGVDELQQAGAVSSGLRTEDTGGRTPGIAVLGKVGLRVGAHVVLLVRLVQCRDQLNGVVEQCEHVRERITEESGDADGDVDARAAELFEIDHFEV